MRREIDILVKAAAKNCVVVEKDSNLVWSLQDLTEAAEDQRFQEADHFLPPEGPLAVSGPYPGCLQMAGRSDAGEYRPVGQTRHFVVFAASAAGSC